MNDERDQLIRQLKDIKAQWEEVSQRADEILKEDEEARRRWTPVVIKGGLAGVAATWIVDHVRDVFHGRPVTRITVSLAAGAILGAAFAPVGDDPPQALPPTTPPPTEGPPTARTPSSTSPLPPLPTTRTGPAGPGTPVTTSRGLESTTPPLPSSPSAPPTTTTGPADPPDEARHDCVVHVAALDVELCLLHRADRLRRYSATT